MVTRSRSETSSSMQSWSWATPVPPCWNYTRYRFYWSSSVKRSRNFSFMKKTAPASPTAPAILEHVTYFSDPVVEEVMDPMNFWKANASRFPSLNKLSRKFLSIPTSSAQSRGCSVLLARCSCLRYVFLMHICRTSSWFDVVRNKSGDLTVCLFMISNWTWELFIVWCYSE